MHTFNPSYEELKAYAKEARVSVKKLLALAPNNDPFYCGMPAQVDKAKWFKDLWVQFGYSQGIHLRRMHYQIISQDPTIKTVNGKPYENTDKCWGELQNASQAARYLDYVDPECFVDRRNSPPEDRIDYETERGHWSLVEYEEQTIALPTFPNKPGYWVKVDSPQRYHLEIWCEKSTQDDILAPLAQEYDLALQYGMGELSITLALEALRRFEKSKKPVRIFYISDFDPAGRNMPRSMAAKLQYFNEKYGFDLDIKLFPLVLSPEQVKAYDLPRTPIKETERRKDKFEQRFGVGATELDALEALHPGELRRLLVRNIEHYYDTTLADRVKSHQSVIENEYSRIQEDVYATYAEPVNELQQEWQAIRAEFEQRIAGHLEKRQRIWQAIQSDLKRNEPAINKDEIPVAIEADETFSPFALFDSSRDYLTQNAVYQAHKGTGDDEDEIA